MFGHLIVLRQVSQKGWPANGRGFSVVGKMFWAKSFATYYTCHINIALQRSDWACTLAKCVGWVHSQYLDQASSSSDVRETICASFPIPCRLRGTNRGLGTDARRWAKREKKERKGLEKDRKYSEWEKRMKRSEEDK